MHATLARNEFFGRRIADRRIGAFALSLTRYDRGTSIPPHAHDEPFVTVVVDGGYCETTRDETRHCAAQSIVMGVIPSVSRGTWGLGRRLTHA